MSDKLENVANAAHCNVKPLDVTPVVLGFNYEAYNAPVYKLNRFGTHCSSASNVTT